MAQLGREEHCASKKEGEKAHRVTRFHADTENDADWHPPARIIRVQQSNEKISDRDAPQIVERDVLKHSPLDERNGSDSRGYGSEQLNVAVSTEFLGYQPGQHHDQAYCSGGKDAKTNKRGTEEN